MKGRTLAQVESLLSRLLAEGNDDVAVAHLRNLVELLRKDRITELEKRIADLQLKIRYGKLVS